MREAHVLVLAVGVCSAAGMRPLAQANLPTAKAETVGISSKRLERIHQ